MDIDGHRLPSHSSIVSSTRAASKLSPTPPEFLDFTNLEMVADACALALLACSGDTPQPGGIP
jgi:hypothetical protein